MKLWHTICGKVSMKCATKYFIDPRLIFSTRLMLIGQVRPMVSVSACIAILIQCRMKRFDELPTEFFVTVLRPIRVIAPLRSSKVNPGLVSARNFKSSLSAFLSELESTREHSRSRQPLFSATISCAEYVRIPILVRRFELHLRGIGVNGWVVYRDNSSFRFGSRQFLSHWRPLVWEYHPLEGLDPKAMDFE